METLQPKSNTIEKIATHGGMFHTDEVFATAILKDLFPEKMELAAGGNQDFIKYLRVHNREELTDLKQEKSTLVIDAGGEYDFENYNIDHHQIEGAGQRENGIDLATAGLIWKHFGREWITYIDVYTRQLQLTDTEKDLIWNKIDKNYIQFIDSTDTGQLSEIDYVLKDGTHVPGNQQFTMSEITRLYNVDCHDGRSHEDRFRAAVEIFRTITLAMVNKYIDLADELRSFKPELCTFNEQGTSMIMDEAMTPASVGHILDNDPKFKNIEFYAVLAKDGKSYFIQTAPTGEGLRTFRNPEMIPSDIRLGNDAKKINELLGISGTGVKFVHNAGHMAQCATRESAQKFLDYCTNKK